MAEPPGFKFNYNNGNPHLLSAIITGISGDSALGYAQKHLFQPLGIADVVWNTDPQGNSDGGDGLYLQPRDMAKIGYLYLRDGMWDGNQIVPSGWIEKLTHRSVDAHMRWAPELRYSSLFWAIPDKRIYAAWGYHGQFIVVMPASGIVVVRPQNSSRPVSARHHNRSERSRALPWVRTRVPVRATGATTIGRNTPTSALNGWGLARPPVSGVRS
jgi:CubicO group peptidase (beta-lactamase class C family)